MDDFSSRIGFLFGVGPTIAIQAFAADDFRTVEIFERLLWPQRYWHTFDSRNAVLTALFMPMGGVLAGAVHKICDEVYYRRSRAMQQETMLETAFFRGYKTPYTVWRDGTRVYDDYCRDSLWVRTFSCVDIPRVLDSDVPQALYHIKLEQKAFDRKADRAVVKIGHETGRPTLTTYTYAIISETAAIIVGGAVATYWRTWAACLWFIPLVLKLLAIYLSLDREGLAASLDRPDDDEQADVVKTYEIELALGTILVEGTDEAVLPTFRHYGYPVPGNPSRRVNALMVIIHALSFCSPARFSAAVFYLPRGLVLLLLMYELYLAFMMCVYHYARGRDWATMEQAVARGFLQCLQGEAERVELLAPDGQAVVSATLTVSPYDDYSDVLAAAAKTIGKKDDAGTKWDDNC